MKGFGIYNIYHIHPKSRSFTSKDLSWGVVTPKIFILILFIFTSRKKEIDLVFGLPVSILFLMFSVSSCFVIYKNSILNWIKSKVLNVVGKKKVITHAVDTLILKLDSLFVYWIGGPFKEIVLLGLHWLNTYKRLSRNLSD